MGRSSGGGGGAGGSVLTEWEHGEKTGRPSHPGALLLMSPVA